MEAEAQRGSWVLLIRLDLSSWREKSPDSPKSKKTPKSPKSRSPAESSSLNLEAGAAVTFARSIFQQELWVLWAVWRKSCVRRSPKAQRTSPRSSAHRWLRPYWRTSGGKFLNFNRTEPEPAPLIPAVQRPSDQWGNIQLIHLLLTAAGGAAGAGGRSHPGQFQRSLVGLVAPNDGGQVDDGAFAGVHLQPLWDLLLPEG